MLIKRGAILFFGVCLLAQVGSAIAMPLTGSLTLTVGRVVPVGGDILTANKLIFPTGAQVIYADGDLAPLQGKKLTYQTLDLGGPLGLLWSGIVGTTTYQYALNNITSVVATAGGVPTSRVISGNGTLSVTGFDPTLAGWRLTSQINGTPTNIYAFSSATSVPEPLPIALLGLGLVSIAVGRRFKLRSAK